jgi:uncharacterized membrane protein
MSAEGMSDPTELPASADAGAGGVVLIGPVPIFFGSWRGANRRTKWLVAAIGGAVLILFVVAWVFAVR